MPATLIGRLIFLPDLTAFHSCSPVLPCPVFTVLLLHSPTSFPSSPLLLHIWWNTGGFRNCCLRFNKSRLCTVEFSTIASKRQSAFPFIAYYLYVYTTITFRRWTISIPVINKQSNMTFSSLISYPGGIKYNQYISMELKTVGFFLFFLFDDT